MSHTCYCYLFFFFFNPVSLPPAGQEKGAPHPGCGAQHTSGRDQDAEVRKALLGFKLGSGPLWVSHPVGSAPFLLPARLAPCDRACPALSPGPS